MPGLPLSYTPDVAKLSHGAGVFAIFANFFAGNGREAGAGRRGRRPLRAARKWVSACGLRRPEVRPPYGWCKTGSVGRGDPTPPPLAARKKRGEHRLRRSPHAFVYNSFGSFLLRKEHPRPENQNPCFSSSLRPIRTPMTEAIIRPRVQPEESPRQCRPVMFVSRSVSILTLLE